MRRLGIALAAFLVLGALVPSRPAAASTANLIAQIDGLVRGFKGTPGLYVADPAIPSPLYLYDQDEQFIAASIYKLGILAEAESRVEAGRLHYTDTIEIQPEDITEDGSYELSGTVMTVDEALEAMITVSDNGSALAFWHLFGGPTVNATLASLGLAAFHIATDDDDNNVVTPRVVGQYLTLLAERRLVSPAASDRILARLGRQQINDRLPAALPPGTRVAHKTGNLVGVTHDAGIIFTSSGPRVVVGLTADADEGDANRFLAGLGSLVYAAQLEPLANAHYRAPTGALAFETGAPQTLSLTVTNAGTQAWTATGSGSVGLIWNIRGAQQSASGGPIPLPALAPNASAPVTLAFDAPTVVGDYTLTVGLADANGNALAPFGAATTTIAVRVHVPFIVAAQIQLPKLLHRSEASLVIVQYSNLPAAGQESHTYTLFWRAVDPRTHRAVASGSSPLGTSLGPGSGTFFAPFNAPSVRGTFTLVMELREAGRTVSDTFTQTVELAGARTFPGDPQNAGVAAPPRVPRASGAPRPSASGALRGRPTSSPTGR